MVTVDVPQLKISDVAQFDREDISSAAGMLLLTFPVNESDLPDNSRVVVTLSRPVCNGDAVVAATRDGRSMTGFYRVNGDEAVIEGVSHKVRLRWRVAEEKRFLHWMFPVLSVDVVCRITDNKKALRREGQRAEPGNLFDRSFQIGDQID